MRGSDPRSTSRLARLAGMLFVLGLPLAVATPLDPAIRTSQQETATQSAGESPAASAAVNSAEAGLEGYTAAAPRSTSSRAVEVSTSAPSGASPVTSIVNDPRCGIGFTAVQSVGRPHQCVHTASDPLPAISGPLAQSAAAAPVCQGNGVNGPRIQLLYMYVEGQPDRSSLMIPRIINEFAPRMEGVFRETSKLQGREIGMRLHMPECQMAVDTLMIDESNGQPDNPGAMLNRITEAVSQQGYATSDRKYVLWFDGGSQGACGVAPAVLWHLLPNVTDNAVTGNISNIGWQAFLPETAVIFRYGAPILGDGPSHIRECWGQGGTGARTEIHELIHLLGAVNLSAPNSNGLGHCTDDHDIMCYGEAGVKTVPRCATPVEQLDCGADDYFNARPSAGSYLSTHWNTANSRFLGEAAVHDAVPLDIPRP